MSRDEWLAKTMLDRPALTQAQIDALRPVFAPVFAQMAAVPAAGKPAGTAPDTETLTTTEPERTRNA